ncbi:MAG: winged helix-turn-helix domain-containing protein [Lachnospiraceae bacterium]|nr:winged helix-turn-helix domain-containing protein [Lachnospiraceae bacterium]
MKILLCDPDLMWAEQLAVHMKSCGMDVKIARELEELWASSEEVQGILVNRQEIESMLFWGEDTMEKAAAAPVSCSSVIGSLRLQGKKVILILPERDYAAECACLQAGAVECFHKQQPFELMVQRILLAFREEMRRGILWFGGVQLDLLAGKLVCRDRDVGLTLMERRVIEILFVHGTTLTAKEEILSELWGEQTEAANVRLDTLLKQIRRKLRGFPIGIYTCYGKGYYLESGLIGGNQCTGTLLHRNMSVH